MNPIEMNLLEVAKQELIRSNRDYRHPFNLMTLATIDAKTGYPKVRTVVMRHIDSLLNVLFYSDSRSPKVAQIEKNNLTSLIWYHPKRKLQVRMDCIAHIVEEKSQLYKDHLLKVKHSKSVLDYKSSLAPGTELNGLEVKHRDEIHFSLIQLNPTLIDILQLSNEGHQRSLYINANEQWQESLLVP